MSRRLGLVEKYLAAVGAFAFLVALMYGGCFKKSDIEDTLDRFESVYKPVASRLTETTSFIEPLSLLDLDKQETITALKDNLRISSDKAVELREGMQELAAFDYSGKLSKLGAYVADFKMASGSALDELDEVYGYLQSLLGKLDAFIRLRAGLPQLSGDQSLKPYLQPLRDLLAACESARTALSGSQPPPVLAEYHDLFMELLLEMRELLRVYVGVAADSGNPQDVSGNPVILRYLALKGRYQQLVSGLYEQLKISDLDPYMEKVELEVNRLYLGRS
jgi:hypothetical protein